MTDALSFARPLFLDPAALDEGALLRVMGTVLGPGVTGGDLYFQQRVTRSWALEDGLVKSGSHDRERGVGIRAICGDRQGLAYADDIEFKAMIEAAKASRAIVAEGASAAVPVRVRPQSAKALYPGEDPLSGITAEQQLDLLRRADAAARAADPRVYQVMVRLAAQHDTIMVLDAQGQLSADVRPLLRLDVTVMVESGTRREQAHAGGGGRDHFSGLLGTGTLPEDIAREAVRQAVVLLDAVAAPAGS